MGVREILEKLSGGQRVYGEPYEKDGVTFVPASVVRAGGGFGTGPDKESGAEATGGGGGVIARPVGAYVIKNGDVRWQPAVDLNRAILGGQILAALALIVYAVTRRAK